MKKESLHRIENYIDGSLDEKERKFLEEDLADETNQQEFEAYIRANHFADLSTRKFNSEAAFDRFTALTEDKNPKKTVFPLNTFYKYAAILALAVLMGFYFFNRSNTKTGLVQISVPNSEKKLIDLPDGSKVEINAGSVLTYNDKDFMENRQVNLIGEAYFQVPKIKGKSFTVNLSKNISIRVLGTSFDVKSYKEDRKIEAALIEGSIEVVSDISGEKNMILKPNSTAVYDKTTQSLEILKDDEHTRDALVWKEDKFIFYRDYLSDIVNELNRSFDVQISIVSEELENQLFTASFDKSDDLDLILHDLSITGNFKVDKTDPLHFKLTK